MYADKTPETRCNQSKNLKPLSDSVHCLRPSIGNPVDMALGGPSFSMAKIRGKFAPIFSELGEDPRWLMECNDQQKFLFILIMLTIYECNNSAPDDPRYYKVRYNLRHRLSTVSTDLAHIKVRFPKLLCKNKKLSLLNYRGYESRVAPHGGIEVEVEEEIEREVEEKKISKPRQASAYLPDDDFLKSLKTLPAYQGIDVDRELLKMDAWLMSPKARGRKKTRQFIINWLNKCDAQVGPETLDAEKTKKRIRELGEQARIERESYA